jgi:DNA-directed RNA polymerase specialized sigma24 family protein
MRAELVEVRFQELYRTYQHQVLAYFLRRTDTASARDGTAETFLVVWRRIDDVPDGAELPWLYGIARRVLANLRRSQRRYSALERKVQRTAVTENLTPEAVVIRRFEDEEMFSAIGRLRPEDREICSCPRGRNFRIGKSHRYSRHHRMRSLNGCAGLPSSSLMS